MDNALERKLEKLFASIGRTPCVDLGDGIYGKLEGQNPAGSVKDRAAFFIIRNALESGALAPNGRVVEATSGNTGIGLAYVCKTLGIAFTAVMPESMSKERVDLMKSYGANVFLTPASEGMSGAARKAKQLSEEGMYFADQFANASSVEAHFSTTAPEIFCELPKTEYVVCGIGSGGTAMGVKKFIVENAINCSVIGVEPAESPLLTKGIAGAHKIQGIGANFVPAILTVAMLDGIIDIKGDEAIAAVREIFVKTGKKCGISSGAAYSAAKRIRLRTEGKIAAVFPDNGDRYDKALYL